MLALQQSRADTVMFDDTVVLGIAVDDPTLKLTDDGFLQAPYGIGIKQGNVALKKWVDSRLNLMRQKDLFIHDPQGQRAEHGSFASFRRTSCGRSSTFQYDTGRPERRHGVPVASTARRERPPRRPLLRSVPMLARLRPLGVRLRQLATSSSGGSSARWRSRRSRSPAPSSSACSAPPARTGCPVVSQVTAVYVEVIRCTPILVQIFIIFFALPQIGITLDAFTVAWLAVMLWGGAFNSENFRAGFVAVPQRYREAALRARLRAARDVPQRDAPDRRAHRAAVVDQHVHLDREEHVARCT